MVIVGALFLNKCIYSISFPFFLYLLKREAKQDWPFSPCGQGMFFCKAHSRGLGPFTDLNMRVGKVSLSELTLRNV